MLLRSLKLKNIRSYLDQTIEFPENSTLLSGDIGSGKSSILLAIEFALFGISKPELTGETLLRKGTSSGSVELSFQLDNKNITIQRNLKKTKEAVTQTAGYLITNNLKKDLTPVELKTEIINLLGYPEDSIAKSKNYLFRYTLYCPQEEMKFILQDLPDNRLDLLRKIFNLDKYKKVRENVWFYLKEIRTQSTIFKTRLEPLDQTELKLKEIKEQEKKTQDQLGLLLPKLTELAQKLASAKKQFQDLEEKNQLHLQLKNQLLNCQNLLKEKQNQQKILNQKQQQLIEKISQTAILQTKEELSLELIQLQQKQNLLLSQKVELTNKIDYCQEQVLTLQKDISQLNEQTSSLENKKAETTKLEKELEQKAQIKEEKEKLENQFNETKQLLHQNLLIFQQSKELKDKITQLDQCPTCLQKVPENHKQAIFQREQQKNEVSEKQIQELEKNKTQQQKQLLEISQQFEILLKKENQLIKFQTELTHLNEKKVLLENKKLQLLELVKQNNLLIKNLEELKPEELEILNQAISEKQEALQKLTRKQELENNLKETKQNLIDIESQVRNFTQEEWLLEQKLSLAPNLTEPIKAQTEILDQLNHQEKQLFSEKTRFQTQQEAFAQQITFLTQEINQLNIYKSNLTKLNELHHWLEEFLVKLTYAIEKQVLVKIHHLFNGLFQEWFSILIEDENLTSRLDDSFTPIIEQNGYEISFAHLSGGERTAASLAYRLALNKVINDIISEIKTKELLILDEPTDGFSSEQLDKVRDVLEKLNLKQTIIVSHESKIESFVDNIIRITKNEGISQII